VRANRLMTNRHVAEHFTTSGLAFVPGVTTSVDLKQEVGSSATLPIQVVATELILETWDIAVLRVDSLPAGVGVLPLAASAPANLQDAIATIIGYPAFDSAESLLQQMQIFRSVFDKKRLQLGRLKGIQSAPSFGRNVAALAHDCSTLGGNSGSVLIDVGSDKVVGVHFLGSPGRELRSSHLGAGDGPATRSERSPVSLIACPEAEITERFRWYHLLTHKMS
jgi:endonuclease G, mitochondrial